MKNEPIYKNKVETIENRVSDLLSRMTIKEKIGQTLCIYAKKGNFQDTEGNYDKEKALKLIQTGAGRIAEVGFVKNTAYEMALLTNEIQKYYVEETRLGIPVLFHEECLHGQMVKGATSFPQPIAMAGTWNPELVQKVYSLIAEETRRRGGHQALTPVADVAREPRWGRVEETFGEDPFLVSEMTAASVKGFQGKKGKFNPHKNLMATLKHFVAHAQPEGGSNCAPVNVSERVLREVFFPPFEKGIKAGAFSVMASYNEVNGVPSHKNKWLLNDVLKKEWGFNGIVVSDYYAVKQLEDRHHVASNEKEAAFQAFEAGVDIELPFDQCYHYLSELIEEGKIQEAYLDEVVRKILHLKFELGLFDHPYVDPDFADKFCGGESNRELAVDAALQSITLLKNQNSVLPLKKDSIKKIAVIGPNANKVLLGGYSGVPNVYATVLEGIKTKVDNEISILYAEGCRITEPGDWEDTDEVIQSNPEEDDLRIEEAKKVAAKTDIVILVIGGNELTSREAWNENHLGDRPSLELIGKQKKLINELAECGKPVVAVLFNGRPLNISLLNEKADAILECWYLGQETGIAVADVLFGDYNPGGKLPISFPRSAGHIPAYYNHKPNDRRGYLFDEVSPLFAFGFGLSYTKFKYKNLKLSKPSICVNDSTQIYVDVENVGELAGHETVQLYIRDCVSSVTRPVKELKSFQKIFLKAGETKTISFEVGFAELAFWNIDMKYLVEPGEFEIMVGSSSRSDDLQSVMLIVVEE
ncbi:MAG: beta-glucosidase [Draconibacterium sp.]|nr:MAG: beta-glucosidase [Draconibacterium sp.]